MKESKEEFGLKIEKTMGAENWRWLSMDTTQHTLTLRPETEVAHLSQESQ